MSGARVSAALLGETANAFDMMREFAGDLLEAVSRVMIQRTRAKGRRKLRRVLVRMWRSQQRLMVAVWLREIRRSGLLLEAASTEGLIHMLAMLMQADETEWAGTLAEVLATVAVEAARSAVKDLQFTGSFDLPTARIEQQIRDHAAELVSGVNQTTRNEIKKILEDAIAERLSYGETAALLRNRFVEFGKLLPQRHIRDRAELIAVTETGNAYVRGQQEIGQSLQDVGIRMEKSWFTAGDERVESECEGNEGEGWIPWDALFSSGHDAPLAHPACRCALQMRRAL